MWSVELSKFQVHLEPIEAFKSQVLTDFVEKTTHSPQSNVWTLFVDGSSNFGGIGV